MALLMMKDDDTSRLATIAVSRTAARGPLALSTWRQPLDELAAVTVPAAVRGCADDPVHPLALARRLARVLEAPLLESSRAESLDTGADARAVEMAVRAAASPSDARS